MEHFSAPRYHSTVVLSTPTLLHDLSTVGITFHYYERNFLLILRNSEACFVWECWKGGSSSSYLDSSIGTSSLREVVASTDSWGSSFRARLLCGLRLLSSAEVTATFFFFWIWWFNSRICWFKSSLSRILQINHSCISHSCWRSLSLFSWNFCVGGPLRGHPKNHSDLKNV